MNRFSRSGMLLSVLLAAPLAAAVVSGPPAGEKVAPLKVFAATGPQKDKEVDYVAERKDKLTVYVILHEWDRPIARFLKTLDTALRDDQPAVEVVAVWLTDKKDEMKTYLPRVQQSLQLQGTSLTYFVGDKSGPNDWNLSPNARVTVVVAKGQKAAASFGYDAINETDVRQVRQAVKKAAEQTGAADQT
jgi:hypothetical protein